MEFEGILRFFENKTILIIGATGFLAKGSLSLSLPMLLKCIYLCLFKAININNLASKLLVYSLLDSIRLCVCIYLYIHMFVLCFVYNSMYACVERMLVLVITCLHK